MLVDILLGFLWAIFFGKKNIIFRISLLPRTDKKSAAPLLCVSMIFQQQLTECSESGFFRRNLFLLKKIRRNVGLLIESQNSITNDEIQ